MHPVIQSYFAKINNLSMLSPKNLPFDVLEALGEMKVEELYKTCSQFFILQNNIPSKDNIISLSEEEIEKGSIKYAQEILAKIKKT